MNTIRALKRRILGRIGLPIPVDARHAEYSVIASADDDDGRPTDCLIRLALAAADRARAVSMADIVARMKQPPYYPEIWPGEHYKFLAGLVQELRPRIVIEIGTATGLSALAIKKSLPERASLRTFDVVSWDGFRDTCLEEEDFADGTLQQLIGDVGDPEVMRRHRDLFRSAGMLFVDGPKDGVFEHKLIDQLDEIGLPKQPIVVFDDIRVWDMLAIWRGIRRPKLDVTSFGHWSGTGIVHWV